MSRLLAAALAVFLPLSASAAGAPKPKAELSRTAGKIIKFQSRIAPSSDGPKFRDGRVTIFDKADHTEEFKVTSKTAVTLDGRPAKFQKAAAIGALVLKALYDPNTKEIAFLDLKSGPKPDTDDPSVASAVHGDISNTDVLKNTITVRVNLQKTVEFAVGEGTTIKREVPGKNAEAVALAELQVGDAVELYTNDGKTAFTIHARAAR